MIIVRYAVCSERQGKAVTRVVVDARADADKALEQIRQQDIGNLEASYWVAELGPEAEAWRNLVPKPESES